jgi:hypothetical protein
MTSATIHPLPSLDGELRTWMPVGVPSLMPPPVSMEPAGQRTVAMIESITPLPSISVTTPVLRTYPVLAAAGMKPAAADAGRKPAAADVGRNPAAAEVGRNDSALRPSSRSALRFATLRELLTASGAARPDDSLSGVPALDSVVVFVAVFALPRIRLPPLAA